MEWKAKESDIFVRLDPGELLVESLRTIAAEVVFSAAAIISGVGMLSSVELGFFDVALDDYRRTVLDGIFDLSSVQGNIMQRELEYVPHVHLVFNDPTFATYSGHLIEATCHITIEMFLSTSVSALRRVRIPGCPATRVVGVR
jgi:predicted DNA-binding protein with PD1-like motif